MAASSICQASNPLECDVCCNVFSEDHCPRILPCSHTFCGPCIDELISTQKKRCPLCREEFTANSAEDFMIIRKLLDVAKQLSSVNLGSKALPREVKRSFLESTKDFIKKSTEQSIADCQPTEAEARDLLTSFSEMKVVFLRANEDIEGFQKTMEELRLSNERGVGDIDQCADLLGNKLQLVLQGVEDIKVFDAKVSSVADFASNGLLLDETGAVVDNFRGKIMELQDLVQKNKRDRERFLKEILKMRAKFWNISEKIEEKLQADSRGIFVVITFEGTLRVAPVKAESNNQLYVNHFQEGVLPPGCFVIELESLMQGSPSPSSFSSPPRAFLDLAYESTHLGKVIIKVFENCMKGLNFLYMCAGGIGPSYDNSQVSAVSSHLFGGDYIAMGCLGERTPNQAVLSSREDWEREMEVKTHKLMPWEAGDVRGLLSYEEASQFWIVTRDDPSYESGYCFGKVEEGLNVLNDAILKYPDRTKIKVARCGLIL
ncbi:E3 ubiquitin-protein ligase TRIM50-like [Macrobrachium rosenbergii]|uniref:E3 ubiquitin-protein ligase TRIM50-like n=1 Tax=Macrobrachium rosenbergii TaxID=79674 RepID=UPI0034D5AAF2